MVGVAEVCLSGFKLSYPPRLNYRTSSTTDPAGKGKTGVGGISRGGNTVSHYVTDKDRARPSRNLTTPTTDLVDK